MARPLFLVLAFRQEAYIADAVRAALRQEGPELDIVMSDDCSDDATWDVIQSVVADYSGPHDVRTVRNDVNTGLIPHLNQRIAETEAQHIIVAAGDDVSEPHRAQRVLETFSETGALLVHSNLTAIHEDGAVADWRPTGRFVKTTDAVAAARALALYVGATGAWDRALFSKYGPLPDGVHEDLILGFRAALEGRVGYVDEPLVQYRVNMGISAQAEGGMSREAWITDRRKIVARGVRTFEQRLVDARTFGLDGDAPVLRALHGKLAEFQARLDVLGGSGGELLKDRSFWSLRHLRAWRSERKREARRP